MEITYISLFFVRFYYLENLDITADCCNYLKIPARFFVLFCKVSKRIDRRGNSVDPDQTAPCQEQSDQGLHCLPGISVSIFRWLLSICFLYHFVNGDSVF